MIEQNVGESKRITAVAALLVRYGHDDGSFIFGFGSVKRVVIIFIFIFIIVDVIVANCETLWGPSTT